MTTAQTPQRPADDIRSIGGLGTESRNPATADLDTLDTVTLLERMNDEDATVAGAVRAQLPRIAEAVELIASARRRGGRLVYVGAGTSGRLGLLDAVECPPTFGTDPSEVVGLIAGGRDAFVVAVEGAEDDPSLGAADVAGLEVGPDDVVVGLAASGRTPYVLGGLGEARERGAATVAVACNPGSRIGAAADAAIEVATGPEVLTGSTRLKAGTAQKLVCNMLTTASMVRTGKAYGNLMVDVLPTNQKLVDRAHRIVAEATGASEDAIASALADAGNHAKTAIVMLLADCDVDRARALLDAAHGEVRRALAAS